MQRVPARRCATVRTVLLCAVLVFTPTPDFLGHASAQTSVFDVLGTAVKSFDVFGASIGRFGWMDDDAFSAREHGLESWAFYVRSVKLSTAVGIESLTNLDSEIPSLGFRGGFRVIPSVTGRVVSLELLRPRCGQHSCPVYLYGSVTGGVIKLHEARADIATDAGPGIAKASGSGFLVGPVVGVEFPVGRQVGGFVEFVGRHYSIPSIAWAAEGKEVVPPAGWPLATSGWVHTLRIGLAVRTSEPPTSSSAPSPSPLSIADASPLPDGIVGSPYEHVLTAVGGGPSRAWTWDDVTPPPGLQLSTRGIISGTPSVADTYLLRVSVMSGGQTVQKAFHLEIKPSSGAPPPVITNQSLPVARRAIPYSHRLTATGGDGTYSWALPGTASALPAGLSLTSSGTVTGTPQSTDTTSVRFTVTSAGRATTKELQVSVIQVPPQVVTDAALAVGKVGDAYTLTLEARGGMGTFTWSVPGGSDLPDGLTMSDAGVLSGTPTKEGQFSFDLTVTSGEAETRKTFTLEVRP